MIPRWLKQVLFFGDKETAPLSFMVWMLIIVIVIKLTDPPWHH